MERKKEGSELGRAGEAERTEPERGSSYGHWFQRPKARAVPKAEEEGSGVSGDFAESLSNPRPNR